MTKERDSDGIGYERRPGPDRGSSCGRGQGGHGRGSGRGRGRGHVPGRSQASGARGQGRGRARDAIYRSEQCSVSSGDSVPSSAKSTGFLTSRPHKQSSLSGLHEILVGQRGGGKGKGRGRGYIPRHKGGDPVVSADGGAGWHGCRLSWVDIRRQSQRSNSTADDSSEPDGSHRALLNFGSDGGWGGRGRGRLLDTSSAKKPGRGEDNDVSGWCGRGRGGILFVPGVLFHNRPGSTGWRHSATRYQGTFNSGHSAGEENPRKNEKRWKKKTEEFNKEAKTDNLRPCESSEDDSHTRGSVVPCVQQSDKKSINNAENTKDIPSEVTTANKEVIDIISPAEGDDEKLLYQRKNSIINNIEKDLQEQLIIRSDDAVSVDSQKPVVPLNCSTEDKSDKNGNCRPVPCPPHAGRSRGIVLFGSRLVTDGGISDKRNAVACGRGVEEESKCKNVFL